MFSRQCSDTCDSDRKITCTVKNSRPVKRRDMACQCVIVENKMANKSWYQYYRSIIVRYTLELMLLNIIFMQPVLVISKRWCCHSYSTQVVETNECRETMMNYHFCLLLASCVCCGSCCSELRVLWIVLQRVVYVVDRVVVSCVCCGSCCSELHVLWIVLQQVVYVVDCVAVSCVCCGSCCSELYMLWIVLQWVVHVVVRVAAEFCVLWIMLQPQFETLCRQMQTVADGDAELSQMEKLTLTEGLLLIRYVQFLFTHTFMLTCGFYLTSLFVWSHCRLVQNQKKLKILEL